jgi:hypothetical protein
MVSASRGVSTRSITGSSAVLSSSASSPPVDLGLFAVDFGLEPVACVLFPVGVGGRAILGRREAVALRFGAVAGVGSPVG